MRDRTVQGRGRGVRRWIAITLVALAAAACTAKYPITGSFDDHNEVFQGEIDHNLMNGTAFIEVKAERSGLRCSGHSRVLHIPASNHLAGAFLIPYCAGQRGDARLRCDDGRIIDGDWQAKTCTSGFGSGSDRRGNTFTFAFGMSLDEAKAELGTLRVAVAEKPDLPVYRPKETRKEKGFSTGTGFFISASGHAITNFHVIEGTTDLAAYIGDRVVPMKIIRTDPANDVAVLKADIVSKPLPIVPSVSTQRGADVFTLGYPRIDIQGQEQKATFGRVNALSGIDDDVRFIQVDVPIQPGNSGGPLFDDQGRVIGIVTQTLNSITALIENGSLPQNVNYAVKSDYALPLLSDIELSQSGGTSGKRFTELVADATDSVFLVVAR
ncbi:MAG: serine protease [Pseudomonadota bacterium]|nr:serine protease [Pseudomonadota bacterium]